MCRKYETCRVASAVIRKEFEKHYRSLKERPNRAGAREALDAHAKLGPELKRLLAESKELRARMEELAREKKRIKGE